MPFFFLKKKWERRGIFDGERGGGEGERKRERIQLGWNDVIIIIFLLLGELEIFLHFPSRYIYIPFNPRTGGNIPRVLFPKPVKGGWGLLPNVTRQDRVENAIQ